MPRTIAIANQKGGVGKTTSTINLASSLAELGRKVLLIDVDSQGNATSGLGIDKNGLEANLYDVFLGVFSISSIIVGTEQNGLWLAPANADLVGAEVHLMSQPERELVLSKQLASISNQFDYILIDCPPSLGLVTLNALACADSVIVPLQCEYYALEGISSLMQTITIVRQGINKQLILEGVLLTMYDSRTNLSKQVVKEARDFFGNSVFDTVIPRNVRLSESPSFGKSVILYDPNSLGAESYRQVARELETRIADRTRPSEAAPVDSADAVKEGGLQKAANQ